MEIIWIESRGGLTLEKALANMGVSRRQRIRLKKQRDSVLVNGAHVPLNYVLSLGDHVCIRPAEHLPTPVPQPIPLIIVWEDDYITVIDKPAGLVVHPTKGYKDQTLTNALAWHWQQQGVCRPARLVTRLDRETSGLVLVAKDAHTHHLLSSTSIYKEYLAYVWGTPEPSSGEISAPLGQSQESPTKRGVDPTGKEALTRYRVENSNGEISLVRLWPVTGRTHQLRIHMAYLGHPLLGDFMYGLRDGPIPRIALHAHRLEFVHPYTKMEVDFCAQLPQDLVLLKASAKWYR